MPVSTKAHHTQLPATPPLLRTMSVTRFGVSALKVVATIETPTNHHGALCPEAKNSARLRPARRVKNRAGARHNSTEASTMSPSSVCSCMGGRRPAA